MATLPLLSGFPTHQSMFLSHPALMSSLEAEPERGAYSSDLMGREERPVGWGRGRG